MFPTPKKVTFRAQLEEEIENVKFTMRHSDILSPPAEGSKLEMSPPKKGGRKDASDYQEEGAALTADQKDVTSPGKRHFEDEEDDENETVPATPVAGRRKRDRQWRWTLGPSQEVDEEVATPTTP